ncbi:MAG: pyridoxamine 5'-phosphate oxidase family protein [Deltaproteobacteria bacterium]|jgi:nitroimidazol reductase NimA-like FMN-containing flavoprotein (pyridoxamine 5'-phosphate oxidase superfamily)|nr:pyridoxamine 5'-phosphate oxidase family protein [Deltaproteobacteria bacterium]
MTERNPRRKDRQISEQEAIAVLKDGEYGVLATVDKDGWPYATPLSYLYKDGLVYFHCAVSGHKIDNLAFNSKVSFVVVGKTKPVYNSGFTTIYASAIVFGQAQVITDPEAKKTALYDLAAKYLPEYLGEAEGSIAHYFARTDVYVIRPERITGKANTGKPRKA